MFIDLLEQELDGRKEAGNQMRFNCPFCGESKSKFYVNIDSTSKKYNLWDCKKCSEVGNPISFTKKYFECNYYEAKDILETFDYDVETNTESFSFSNSGLTEEEKLYLALSGKFEQEVEEPKVNYTMPALPTNFKLLSQNFSNPEAYPFFTYLNNRGVTLEQIYMHNIGYVTKGEVTLVSGKKMTLQNHVIFLTHDDEGKAVYWNTRSIEPNPYIKSFNAPSLPHEYSKRNTMFNINRAAKLDRIVIQEGVFDALTVGDTSVATFGKKVTEEQIQLIFKCLNGRRVPIYIFLDMYDAAKEMLKLAEDIQRVDSETPVYFVMNDSDLDANKMGKEAAEGLIRNAILADDTGKLILALKNEI